MGQNFRKIEAVSLTAFFQFFFDDFPKSEIVDLADFYWDGLYLDDIVQINQIWRRAVFMKQFFPVSRSTICLPERKQ